MINFFLDTNIVIDFLTDRKPFSYLAGKLFDYSEKGEVKLYLSAVSYSNIYYVVRKVSSHKETIKILSRLEEMTEIIDTTSSTIKNAIDSEFKDFEDALQYYSAKLNTNINGIVTRNGGDFKHSTISILTPEEAIRFVESASR
jgi:predicted nucleic acid-binding protein